MISKPIDMIFKVHLHDTYQRNTKKETHIQQWKQFKKERPLSQGYRRGVLLGFLTRRPTTLTERIGLKKPRKGTKVLEKAWIGQEQKGEVGTLRRKGGKLRGESGIYMERKEVQQKDALPVPLHLPLASQSNHSWTRGTPAKENLTWGTILGSRGWHKWAVRALDNLGNHIWVPEGLRLIRKGVYTHNKHHILARNTVLILTRIDLKCKLKTRVRTA